MIGYEAFGACAGLTDLNLPHWYGDAAKSIDISLTGAAVLLPAESLKVRDTPRRKYIPGTWKATGMYIACFRVG